MHGQLTKQTRTLQYSKKDCFKRTVARVFPLSFLGRDKVISVLSDLERGRNGVWRTNELMPLSSIA